MIVEAEVADPLGRTGRSERPACAGEPGSRV